MILRALLVTAMAVCGLTWSKEASAVQMVEVCTFHPVTICGPDGTGCYVSGGMQCHLEDWGGGGGNYNPDPDPYYGGGGGSTTSSACLQLRSQRPENCGDAYPGTASDNPRSEPALDEFDPYPANRTRLVLPFRLLYGCIGGYHNSIQGCAGEIFNQFAASCHYPDCWRMLDFLREVQDMPDVSGYLTDTTTFSVALPAQFGVSGGHEFPEWFRILIADSRSQTRCALWHNDMQTAGCAP